MSSPEASHDHKTVLPTTNETICVGIIFVDFCVWLPWPPEAQNRFSIAMTLLSSVHDQTQLPYYFTLPVLHGLLFFFFLCVYDFRRNSRTTSKSTVAQYILEGTIFFINFYPYRKLRASVYVLNIYVYYCYCYIIIRFIIVIVS